MSASNYTTNLNERQKTCTKCNIVRSFAEYYDNKNTRDGKESHCSHCKRAYSANKTARKRNVAGIISAIDITNQFHRQSGKCYYCQSEISLGEYSIDHLQAMINQGGNTRSNIVCACFSCNMRKNAIPYEDALCVILSKGELKWCNGCKRVRHASKFRKNRSNNDGLSSTCRTCATKAHNKWLTNRKNVNAPLA